MFAIFALLLEDAIFGFAYPEYRFEEFSSFQFKFAQYYTWMMKNIAKHKKIAKYILHGI